MHEVPFPCRNQGCDLYPGANSTVRSKVATIATQGPVNVAAEAAEGEQLSELEASTAISPPMTDEASTIEFFLSTTIHSDSASPVIPEAMLASTCSAPATFRLETRKGEFNTSSRFTTASWKDNLLWPSFSTSCGLEDARAQLELREE